MKKIYGSNLQPAVLLVILFLGFTNLSSAGVVLPALAEEGSTTYFPLVLNQFDTRPGTVEGKILDSSIPDSPIVGAEVCFMGSLCSKTDENGAYSLGPIPAGLQQLSATMEGYYPVQSSVYARAASSTILNFALSPKNSESYEAIYRIVLTWDPTPYWTDPIIPGSSVENDLDAHLWINAYLDAHISQENQEDCTLNPYACLEADERNGFGPETIVISALKPDAVYSYGVLNFNSAYSFVPPISRSSAVVQVYDHAGLLKEYRVPEAGEAELWYVFSMDGEGNITDTNCITNLPDEGEIPQCP